MKEQLLIDEDWDGFQCLREVGMELTGGSCRDGLFSTREYRVWVCNGGSQRTEVFRGGRGNCLNIYEAFIRVGYVDPSQQVEEPTYVS